MAHEVGYQVFGASGVLGDSGKSVAIYGYAIKSGATGGVVSFKSGSVVGGTFVYADQGTANVTKTFNFGFGNVFPSGCYVSFDSNVSAATIFYRQMRT